MEEGKPTEILTVTSIDQPNLAEVDKTKVEEIKKSFAIMDSNAAIQFGTSAQTKISEFSDSILSEVRNKDTGYVGNVLTDLMMKVREIDVDSLSDGFNLSKIPIIGQFINAFNRFLIRYDKVSVNIEKLLNELDKAKMNMLKDITIMDKLYELNKDYIKELDAFIVAGGDILSESKTKTLPEFEAKAKVTNDPMDAQKVSDFNSFIDRFEKKLHDLKLSRIIAIQTAPQLRLIQGGNQVLVEKIQTSILNTIPLWKNQIVIAISLYRQKKALELQKEVYDTTNELLKKNSEMLKESTIEIAKESEKGIVDIETLKKVNADLITTIEEAIRIQQEGRAKRTQVEEELVKIESDLKAKLTQSRM